MKSVKQLAGATSLAVLAISLAACDSTSAPGSEDIALSFRATTSSAAVASVGSGAVTVAADPITVDGHTLDLQQVQLTVRNVELEQSHAPRGGNSDADTDEDTDGTADADTDAAASDTDTDSDVDTDGDESDDASVRVAEATIDLPLGGGVVTPFTAPVPVGSYDELKMHVRTVRLRGTYDGNPFDVTLRVHTKLEFDFDPPFVVATDADTPNVTLSFNLSDWLRSNTGAIIDPRRIESEPAVRAHLKHRIRRSLRALEDRNRNGSDDSDTDSH